jgi:DNA uptake protein ComE-like DNA-binding protein
MPTPPSLSPEQRAAALKKAAEVRVARAELKERLKMGSTTISDVMAEADSNDVIGKLKVLTLLESLPGLGKVKARRLLEELEIAESRRVQGLGEVQKRKLLEALTK